MTGSGVPFSSPAGCEMLGCPHRPRPKEGGVSVTPGDPGPASLANGAAADEKARARSIGEVASPLLAGFSFTNVIVIAMSSDTENFLLPGVAMISWTVASIAFIASVGFAKYVAEPRLDSSKVEKYEWRTDFCYHFGIVTFLLGFGLALAPQHSSGSYVFRWVASIVAFLACAIWAGIYVKRALDARLPKLTRKWDLSRARGSSRRTVSGAG
jgi:hypothetical protein